MDPRGIWLLPSLEAYASLGGWLHPVEDGFLSVHQAALVHLPIFQTHCSSLVLLVPSTNHAGFSVSIIEFCPVVPDTALLPPTSYKEILESRLSLPQEVAHHCP